MNELKHIEPTETVENNIKLIGKDWMLVTSADREGSLECGKDYNTMTASWGGVGVMWGKPSATCYIRQSRYTKTFVDDSEFFTLTVLKDGCRDALNLLGSKSGRDMDKMHESGLTPVMVEGQPTFEEAKLVLVCRKACKTFIGPDDMTAENVDRWYGDRDYHTMYIGEIVAAYEA